MNLGFLQCTTAVSGQVGEVNWADQMRRSNSIPQDQVRNRFGIHDVERYPRGDIAFFWAITFYSECPTWPKMVPSLFNASLGDVDALFPARTFYAGDMEFVKYP